jgi:hypothetical protein
LLVGCGSKSPGTIVPEGPHYHYVVNQALVPISSPQADEFGIDIGSALSNKPDGMVDNQLGRVLATLTLQGFDIQGALDKAVAEGTIILLVDVQTKDFTTSSAAGVDVLLGDSPNPSACNGSADMYTCTMPTPPAMPVCSGCGHHLDGHGMFNVSADSPSNAPLGGKIMGGTFTGGPGEITLQIALGGATPITLDLVDAYARVSMFDPTMIGNAILAGALTQDQLHTTVLPNIQMQLAPIITRDCNMLTMPPGCGCTDGTTGSTIISLFDKSPADCAVTLDELENNSLIKSLLAPDVCSTSKCAMPDALSLGVKVSAVPGAFTVPGQVM